MNATSETLTVALPQELAGVVHEAVRAGDYASSSEVVRNALHEWSERRRMVQDTNGELRRMWQEARSDNSPGLEPDAVFAELEAKYQTQGAPGTR